MQNGDYDGDRFWVTSDPAIFDKFLVLPAQKFLGSRYASCPITCTRKSARMRLVKGTPASSFLSHVKENDKEDADP